MSLHGDGRTTRAGCFLVVVALLLSGCGSSMLGSARSMPDHRRSPAALASLQAQGDRLLLGGLHGFERRLRSLRGYPVVVNMWAGWCPACLSEFPILEEVAPRFASRVAFVGVNWEDSLSGARSLLGEANLSYPSYADSDGDIVSAIGSISGVPDTAFFGPDGSLQHIRYGPYVAPEELEADLLGLLRGELTSG